MPDSVFDRNASWRIAFFQGCANLRGEIEEELLPRIYAAVKPQQQAVALLFSRND